MTYTGGAGIFIEVAHPLASSRIFGKGRIHSRGVTLRKPLAVFFKGAICWDHHQGAVHDFDCVRAKLFPGQLTADDAAFKSLLIFKAFSPFVRRAEVMEKRNRDAVCRFARQKVHESFTRMPQLCAHVFILFVKYFRRYPARMEAFRRHAPFLFLPGAGRRGHHPSALRGCFTLRARARLRPHRESSRAKAPHQKVRGFSVLICSWQLIPAQ